MSVKLQKSLIKLATTAIIFTGSSFAENFGHMDTQALANNGFPNGLTLKIGGVRNSKGNVVVLIFDNKKAYDNYDYNNAVGYESVRSRKGTVTVKIPYLTKGPLAITAFHDEDGNQDLNMDGEIPTEGYAISGAKDASDLPNFKNASIFSGKVAIRMFYFD
ncbi:MAG: DUF2141 domain-containing protein [Pseudomonadota bacterium]